MATSGTQGRGHAAALLVGHQPVPVGRPLDQRHRTRRAVAVLGLDPPAAERWAGPGRCSRATAPSFISSITTRSGWPGCEPRVVGQQPHPRRDGRAVRRRLAFPWFPESSTWREAAATELRRELVRQTFASGLNRELATDYHGFVLELGLAAALEGELAGHPLGGEVWDTLRRMTDALAAIVDQRLRPPRQGDADDGTACSSTGPATTAGPPCWPPVRRCSVGRPGGRPRRRQCAHRPVDRLAARPLPGGARPAQRPSLFADAGMALLRDTEGRPDELWCRADHGPHGYLSIAAHAHADALAIEVRAPGSTSSATLGPTARRRAGLARLFPSTLAHNTLEVGGSASLGGRIAPVGPARPDELERAAGLDGGPVADGGPITTATGACAHRRPPPERPAGPASSPAGRRGSPRRGRARVPPGLPSGPRRRLHARRRSGRPPMVGRPRPTGRHTDPPRRAGVAAPGRADRSARGLVLARIRRTRAHGHVARERPGRSRPDPDNGPPLDPGSTQ